MPPRILVIEDNPANLELVSYLLRAFGFELEAAEDGLSGVESAIRTRPDLIICDVQLPGLDGYEVARRLKSDSAMRLIPLVAVTALAMVGDRDRVLAAGFDGYLSKPIDPEKFLLQIQGFLNLSAAPSGSRSYETAPAAASTATVFATILVVDDQPIQLELARSILEPHGFRVLVAAGVKSALAAARSNRCDLILSDVCLNGESGYTLIQAVKADPELASIPFVFLTSTMLDERDRTRGLALGAARFLIRPIEPALLLAELRACLREGRNASHCDHPHS